MSIKEIHRFIFIKFGSQWINFYLKLLSIFIFLVFADIADMAYSIYFTILNCINWSPYISFKIYSLMD